jgi:hypothetical protein
MKASQGSRAADTISTARAVVKCWVEEERRGEERRGDARRDRLGQMGPGTSGQAVAGSGSGLWSPVLGQAKIRCVYMATAVGWRKVKSKKRGRVETDDYQGPWIVRTQASKQAFGTARETKSLVSRPSKTRPGALDGMGVDGKRVSVLSVLRCAAMQSENVALRAAGGRERTDGTRLDWTGRGYPQMHKSWSEHQILTGFGGGGVQAA